MFFRIGSTITLILVLILTIAVNARAQISYERARYIYPSPGSTLVPPETDIIVRAPELFESAGDHPGVAWSVSGSRSGVHGGTWYLSDDHASLIFQPSTAFTREEDVVVSVAAGIPLIGAKRLEALEFRFHISPFTSTDRELAMEGSAVAGTPLQVEPHVLSLPAAPVVYGMASDSMPAGMPKWTVHQYGETGVGSLFLASFKIAEAGDHLHFISLVPSNSQFLMVLDNSGRLLYHKRMVSLSSDFKLQPNGLLTYYDDATGQYEELDSTYAAVDSFRTGNGYKTDLHDLTVLPNGHALIIGDDPEPYDMSAVVPGGNPNAIVIGCVIQELDRNKHVVFQWRSFDHFKVTDATHEDLTAATIDEVHPNTIEVDTDGNLLLSSRHMDEVTKIDRQTGAVLWRLGGKNNQFRFINDTVGFSHQHSVRRTPTGTLLLFDNGNYRSPMESRAVEYSVDESAKTVKLIWQYRHTPDARAVAMGSVQRLPNGNTLIGWGSASPAITEVRPDGSVAFELQLPDSIVSYRAFRFPWKETGSLTSVTNTGGSSSSASLQNYPNPFNPTTTIHFTVLQKAHVSLKVYDMIGRVVAVLYEGTESPGPHAVVFNGSHLASGTYICRLSTPEGSESLTMALVK